jgi:uncharacterized protein YbcI
MAFESPPDEQLSMGGQISRLIVQTLHECSGRGPTKAQTLIGRNSVHVVLGDTLTKGERTLAEAGHEATVLESRKQMQDVMRPQLVVEVEKLMGRKVIAFMSENHIDPDFAVESFVLEPAQDDVMVVSEETS